MVLDTTRQALAPRNRSFGDGADPLDVTSTSTPAGTGRKTTANQVDQSPPRPVGTTSRKSGHSQNTQQTLAADNSDGSTSNYSNSICRPPVMSQPAKGSPKNARSPREEEQALFEQRLLEDSFGVAVRKINQYGKSSLRYVRCLSLEDVGSSVGSTGASNRRRWSKSTSSKSMQSNDKCQRVLCWGKKKSVQIPINRFVCVRKGKTTDRARKNPCPASRILSIVTKDSAHPSLDIEAPTRLDRDKFARAFSRFLNVPLEGGDDCPSVHSERVPSSNRSATSRESGRMSAPPSNTEAVVTARRNFIPRPPLPTGQQTPLEESQPISQDSSSEPSSFEHQQPQKHVSVVPRVDKVPEAQATNADDGSDVSSLTGHGYDQELVEELHNALNELRGELEESRAEAARAVKVAEQAIQSAEKTSSQQWQNTVTHKAAEAAAMAQKRSAEAMAKQRLAEQKLEREQKMCDFWKRRTETAEEEASKLQTRAAVAELQHSTTDQALASEKRLALKRIEALEQRCSQVEERHRLELQEALMNNQALQRELDETAEVISATKTEEEKSRRKTFGRRRKSSKSSTDDTKQLLSTPDSVTAHSEQLKSVYRESVQMRGEIDELRQSLIYEMGQVPEKAKDWTNSMSHIVKTTQDEVHVLRKKLAVEAASRRKLLHEVQDLRGNVRTYCRPRPTSVDSRSIVSLPSQDTVVLHREIGLGDKSVSPLSYEFDKVFDQAASQVDVFNEVADVCLSALDGYQVCLMSYGQTGCGKTFTMLGEIDFTQETVHLVNHGLQLQTMKHLFNIAHDRSDQYSYSFHLNLVEVHEEKLTDMLAGSVVAEERGSIVSASSRTRRKNAARSDDADTCSTRQSKLEIRTDVNGDTVIQGSTSVPVSSFDEFVSIWLDCLTSRAQRLVDAGIDVGEHEGQAHLVAMVQVRAEHLMTGTGCVGKVQFADLAGSDTVESMDRSLRVLAEVADAKAQYSRTVPFRSSTLTHLLRDSLESDTKVLFFACVSSDEDDLESTRRTLQFASRMQRVNIGKATKNIISPP